MPHLGAHPQLALVHGREHELVLVPYRPHVVDGEDEAQRVADGALPAPGNALDEGDLLPVVLLADHVEEAAEENVRPVHRPLLPVLVLHDLVHLRGGNVARVVHVLAREVGVKVLDRHVHPAGRMCSGEDV